MIQNKTSEMAYEICSWTVIFINYRERNALHIGEYVI